MKSKTKGFIALALTAAVVFYCSTQKYVTPGVALLVSVLMLVGLYATALFFAEDCHQIKSNNNQKTKSK